MNPKERKFYKDFLKFMKDNNTEFEKNIDLYNECYDIWLQSNKVKEPNSIFYFDSPPDLTEDEINKSISILNENSISSKDFVLNEYPPIYAPLIDPYFVSDHKESKIKDSDSNVKELNIKEEKKKIKLKVKKNER